MSSRHDDDWSPADREDELGIGLDEEDEEEEDDDCEMNATTEKSSGVRVYTAQEMRYEASRPCVSVVVAAMLRQAADMMERENHEKKYEYAEKFKEGMVAYLHRDRPVDHCEMWPGSIAVRRYVGEWEEVKE